MFQAMAWVHPVVLALVWAHAIISSTRIPAGEVDRGTADVLLSLPVSRWELLFVDTVVGLCSGLVLLAAGLAGNVLGGLNFPPEQRPHLVRVLIVLVNLFSLYIAAGGLGTLISSFSDRRGRALTSLFLLLLSLFLLNYLAEFWHPLEKFVFLSPLHYHKPVSILAHGGWPWKNLIVLLGSGAVLWLIGGFIFARRDLCTV
jgi:ABC-type transport system involved in multi-copper enzyme maturation permease subunit